MDSFRKLCQCLGLVVVLVSSSEATFAQGDVQMRAESLFREALRMMQADRCLEAIPLFAESNQLDPAAATLANLAACKARLGKTGSAYRIFLQASRAAILEDKPGLKRLTDEAAHELEPTLTRLRVISVAASARPLIRINGEPVEDVTSSIPLDPGENIIEASAPGRESWRRTLTVQGANTLMVVEVPELAYPQAPVRGSEVGRSPRDSIPTTERRASAESKPYALVAAGLGAAGLSVGAVLALSSRSKQQVANDHCDGRYCTPTGIALREAARDRADAATWSVAIGALLLGGAAALWCLPTATNRAAPVAGLHLTVGPLDRGATFILDGDL
jgi:hypothetical protein